MLEIESLTLDAVAEPWRAGSSGGPTVVLSTVSSDAHSWNLVLLQLLLEEAGCTVCNLGPCTPSAEVLASCLDLAPELLVVSSVNGHGLLEIPDLVRMLRKQPRLDGGLIVVGGKLSTSGGLSAPERASLLYDGVDRVFEESEGLASFSQFLRGVSSALCGR